MLCRPAHDAGPEGLKTGNIGGGCGSSGHCDSACRLQLSANIMKMQLNWAEMNIIRCQLPFVKTNFAIALINSYNIIGNFFGITLDSNRLRSNRVPASIKDTYLPCSRSNWVLLVYKIRIYHVLLLVFYLRSTSRPHDWSVPFGIIVASKYILTYRLTTAFPPFHSLKRNTWK